MQLKSSRFILRYPDITDLSEFHRNINDKEIAKNIPQIKYPVKKDIANHILKDMIKENSDKGKCKENFIIEIDRKVAGTIGLTKIVKNDNAEIWYWLGKEFRSKGIIKESISIVSDYAFKKYKLHEIYASMLATNIASIKALESSGFNKKELRKVKIRDKYFDELIYSKTK